MSVSEPSLVTRPGAGMDRTVQGARWSPRSWPLAAQVGAAAAGLIAILLIGIKLLAGPGDRVFRVPAAQLTVAAVEEGIFRDLIPLRAIVEPRETVYIDAIDGGRVDRVLVEAGDLVEKGQPLIELSNPNLALSVIQQE